MRKKATAWHEKEAYFDTRFRNGTYCKHPANYIPKPLFEAGAIAQCSVDSDGYWIWLEAGWTSRDGGSDCGVIHNYLITDMVEDIKTIRRID